ncbi:hypothetical protein [Aureimonas psammosilenae]|uniref:hypothetical protein n=1 Tax=Aureimonas psammosilenae TaxID=2495496 RepID=UPI0012610E69|nr:hypothetical protein [Aureimonas psammosilenae]
MIIEDPDRPGVKGVLDIFRASSIWEARRLTRERHPNIGDFEIGADHQKVEMPEDIARLFR